MDQIMEQLSLFDIKESYIEIVKRQGIIKNQVSVFYKGFHIANARDLRDGYYEVRPRNEYFSSNQQKIMIMDKVNIEKLAEDSFVKYHLEG
jgi:hypothetical protein